MNGKDLISVIVPVYNVKPYLSRCIESITNQKYRNLEIFLIDDGSTDGSGELCDKFALSDSRIKVVHQENKGQSVARNVGVELSKGKYIAFVDADDVISENYMEVLYENLIKYNADVSVCRFVRFEKEAKILSHTENIPKIIKKEEVYALLSGIGGDSTPFVVAWGKLIRKKIACKLSFLEGKWHEDEFYTNHLFEESECVVETPAELYFYRQRPDSIVGKQNQHDIRHIDIVEAFEKRVKICRKVCNKNLYQQVVASYRWLIIKYYFLFSKTKYSYKLKWKFIRSFFCYPVKINVKFKGYIVFLVSSKWYSKKYSKHN